MSEQHENIERVSARIGRWVLDWCVVGKVFHMEDLVRYVEVRLDEPVAPDSPGRIMRDLRQKGVLNYEVLSRSQSLYKIIEGTHITRPTLPGTALARKEFRQAAADMREMFKIYVRATGKQPSAAFIKVAKWIAALGGSDGTQQ